MLEKSQLAPKPNKPKPYHKPIWIEARLVFASNHKMNRPEIEISISGERSNGAKAKTDNAPNKIAINAGLLGVKISNRFLKKE